MQATRVAQEFFSKLLKDSGLATAFTCHASVSPD